MSLDETAERMRAFSLALYQFNDRLLASYNDLRHHHGQVSGLWQDEFRRNYDAQWEPFDQSMIRYLNQERQAYADFISGKLNLLERYLHGD